MFGNNPFLKNDSLLEAVKGAQHDGECRRQAEKIVNEEFGVYSRKAVVREHLAAYDAALEEVYTQLREGLTVEPVKNTSSSPNPTSSDISNPSAQTQSRARMGATPAVQEGKKPNDGNLANNYPPYDKVTRGDVIAGRLGKDQMGGKKKMDEKKMCEGSGVSGEDPGMAVAKQAGARQQAQTPSSTPARTGNAAGSTISNARAATGMNEEEQIDEVSKGRAISAYRQKEGEERDTSKLHGLIKRKFGKETAKHAERAGAQDTVGLVRRGEDRGKEDSIARDQRLGSAARITKGRKVHRQDTSTLKGNIKRRLGSHTKANLPEEAQIDEATRKHFRQHAADISKISDQDERNKAASAAASTYARLNPRFDHAKFHKAAGSTAHEAQAMKESVIASLFEKYSFKAAQETGKSVNEIAMTTPPAIVQPAVSGVKQTQAAKPLATARFGQQGAGARPMTATPSVTRTMASPASRPVPSVAGGMSQAGKQAASQSIRSSIAQKMAQVAGAGKDAVTAAASRAPAVSRIAGLAARMNPIAGAAMTGAAASQALGKLATGTETGRAIGRSIGRAINPPVSTLPKAEPAAAPAKATPATIGINKGDTMTSIARAQKTTVADLAKANPDIKDVNKISAGKSLNLPAAAKPTYTPKPVDQADTIRQSGGEPSVQTGTAASRTAPLPPARPADLGTTSANVPTPPSRPTFGSDLPNVDKGPAAGPVSGPNPKMNVPTPPASSERPAPAPMQNPDQERTKVKAAPAPMSESVVSVNGNKYRIV